MPRPSSISGSKPLAALLAFFALSLASAMVLDLAAFSGRGWLSTRDMGRWKERQWATRRAALARRDHAPELLVVGDSSAGYGIWPGLLTEQGFNLSRPGLSAHELDSLDERLGRLLKGRPKAILVGMLWFQFMEGDGEFAFAQGHPPTWRALLSRFYSDPNLSQKRVFPGSRVARYWIDSHLESTVPTIQAQVARFREDGAAVSLIQPSSVSGDTLPDQPAYRPGWYDPGTLAPLGRFRARWEQRGVPVLFVFLPLHPELRRGLQRRCPGDLARWHADVQRLFGPRCLDLESVVVEAGAFRDGTHLTEDGARRLTLALAPRVEPFLHRAEDPLPSRAAAFHPAP